MVVRSTILLSAIFAFGLSGVAAAESPKALNPVSLSEMAGLSLDKAFEKATSPEPTKIAHPTGGPTNMKCESGAALDGFETCVVTAQANVAALPSVLPAAMAPR